MEIHAMYQDCAKEKVHPSVEEEEGTLSLGGDIWIKFQKVDVSKQVNEEWVEDILG